MASVGVQRTFVRLGASWPLNLSCWDDLLNVSEDLNADISWLSIGGGSVQ